MLTKSTKLAFGVKHIKLSGWLHILLSPLTSNLLVVSAIQYSLVNPPEIKMRYTGTGGRILNVAQLKLLGVIDSFLVGVLVLPNRIVMPVDLGWYIFLETDHPSVRMARLVALGGRRFKLHRGLLNDVPVVYCVMRLGASKSVCTSMRTDNLAPEWEDESHNVVIYNMDQKVYVDV